MICIYLDYCVIEIYIQFLFLCEARPLCFVALLRRVECTLWSILLDFVALLVFVSLYCFVVLLFYNKVGFDILVISPQLRLAERQSLTEYNKNIPICCRDSFGFFCTDL